MRLLDILPNPYPSQPKNDHPNTYSDAFVWRPYHESVSLDAAERNAKNKLGIQLGEHWGIVGGTGSGKTTGAVALVEYLRRRNLNAKRYIHDASGDDESFDQCYAPLHVYGNRAPDLLVDSLRTQIWSPDTDDANENNIWFSRILRAREPAVVLVDEVSSVKDCDEFVKLLKQGRKHGITVLCNTQKIAKVPSDIFDQCTHFMQFRLNRNPYEWQRARELLNILNDEQKPPTNKYGFFYRRQDGPYVAREYRDYKEFFGHSLLYKAKQEGK